MKKLFFILSLITLYSVSAFGALDGNEDTCIEGNCINGKGTMSYADGSKYIGQFKEGLSEGQGIMMWPDGQKYVGQFKDDLLDGQGIMTWPDGRKYVGQFKDGLHEGLGSMTWPDGQKYVGQWKNDQYEGLGILIKKYVGQFKGGQYEGQELSESEINLKLAELEKAELETRLAAEDIEKDEEVRQKEEEEKALREAAEKERIEDEKYYEIGVRPVEINCRWSMSTDFGSQLYVPTINLKLKNVSTEEITNSKVRVVFIDIDNKEIFDESTDYFISEYTNTPLKIGYSKEIIIKASKGYRYAGVIVPDLTAEIYIDDQLLVSVPVSN